MNISIEPELEARLREKAQTEGLSVEAFIANLLRSEDRAEAQLEEAGLEGLESGERLVPDADYWQQKHRLLDARLKKTGTE